MTQTCPSCLHFVSAARHSGVLQPAQWLRLERLVAAAPRWADRASLQPSDSPRWCGALFIDVLPHAGMVRVVGASFTDQRQQKPPAHSIPALGNSWSKASNLSYRQPSGPRLQLQQDDPGPLPHGYELSLLSPAPEANNESFFSSFVEPQYGHLVPSQFVDGTRASLSFLQSLQWNS